jgi:Ca2+-binding RTX toxin-like protein
VRINNGATQTFTGVTRVIVLGQSGDDTITLDRNLTVARFLYGGEGNDVINGGNATGVQVGGPGNDRLNGGNGRDLLLGGAGVDAFSGGNGDDLLVAGTTTYDATTTANQQQLCAISAEWNSGSTYAARVAHLLGGAGGLNGTAYLRPGVEASDDGVRDTLTGAKGVDWFVLNRTAPGTLDASDRTNQEIGSDL